MLFYMCPLIWCIPCTKQSTKILYWNSCCNTLIHVLTWAKTHSHTQTYTHIYKTDCYNPTNDLKSTTILMRCPCMDFHLCHMSKYLMPAQKRQVNPLSSKAPAINQPQSIHYYSCLLFEEKKIKLKVPQWA